MPSLCSWHGSLIQAARRPTLVTLASETTARRRRRQRPGTIVTRWLPQPWRRLQQHLHTMPVTATAYQPAPAPLTTARTLVRLGRVMRHHTRNTPRAPVSPSVSALTCPSRLPAARSWPWLVCRRVPCRVRQRRLRRSRHCCPQARWRTRVCLPCRWPLHCWRLDGQKQAWCHRHRPVVRAPPRVSCRPNSSRSNNISGACSSRLALAPSMLLTPSLPSAH